jgi:hypothetical protein
MRLIKSIFQKSVATLLLGLSLLVSAEIKENKAIAENLRTGLTNELANDNTCDGTGGGVFGAV